MGKRGEGGGKEGEKRGKRGGKEGENRAGKEDKTSAEILKNPHFFIPNRIPAGNIMSYRPREYSQR